MPSQQHQWTLKRRGGSPDIVDSYEQVIFCDQCGTELTDDNEDEACEALDA